MRLSARRASEPARLSNEERPGCRLTLPGVLPDEPLALLRSEKSDFPPEKLGRLELPPEKLGRLLEVEPVEPPLKLGLPNECDDSLEEDPPLKVGRLDEENEWLPQLETVEERPVDDAPENELRPGEEKLWLLDELCEPPLKEWLPPEE